VPAAAFVLVAVLASALGAARAQPVAPPMAWDLRQVPAAAGVRTVAGFDGPALELDAGAAVTLPGRDADRRAVLNPAGFAVRWFLRPTWSGTNVPGGRGPGAWTPLLAFGDEARRPREGFFELAVDPSGTVLRFTAAAGPGRRQVVNAAAAARFTANRWSEISLSAFPDRLLLVQGGILLHDARRPALPAPAAAAAGDGVRFATGGGAVAGITAGAAPLAEVDFFHEGFAMSATASDAPPGLALEWRLPPEMPFELQRAADGTTNWTTLLAAAGPRRHFDAEVRPGEVWRYRLVTNRYIRVRQVLRAGLRAPAVTDRGTLLLLVDETLAPRLAPDLAPLARDLGADGWHVVQRPAPRHDDARWEANRERIARTKATVLEVAAAAPRPLRAIWLLGHVAVPYGGFLAEDNHTGRGDNHFGAWPHDLYYGDFDGVWTDTAKPPAYVLNPVTHPETVNVPGDGKWDTAWIARNAAGDATLEAAVARTDFARLPGAAAARRLDEAGLTRAYLEKVRRWRAGTLRAGPRLVVAGLFGGGNDFPIYWNAAHLGPRLFGSTPGGIVTGDLFAPPDRGPFLFGLQSAAGAPGRIRNGGPNQLTGGQIAGLDPPPPVAFAILIGSWFGDYQLGEDNVLRSFLATRDHGLAAVWTRFMIWRFDELALGGTLGDAVLRTANESIVPDDHNLGTSRTAALLGDPTLRWPQPAAPRGLTGRRTGGAVELEWTRSPDAELGHLLERRTGGEAWAPLAQVPAGPARFRDAAAPPDAAYRVRALRLERTGCGSFTNVSAGVTWP
jgi:hypothetical protein